MRHIGVVARRIRAIIPVTCMRSVAVIASAWRIIGPTPSAAPPPAAEGGNHDKSTAEARVTKEPRVMKEARVTKEAKVMKSAVMEFAKPAVMKSAAVKCRKSGMESTTVESAAASEIRPK